MPRLPFLFFFLYLLLLAYPLACFSPTSVIFPTFWCTPISYTVSSLPKSNNLQDKLCSTHLCPLSSLFNNRQTVTDRHTHTPNGLVSCPGLSFWLLESKKGSVKPHIVLQISGYACVVYLIIPQLFSETASFYTERQYGVSEIGGREKVDCIFILLKGMEIRLGPIIWEISRTQGKTKNTDV